MNSWILYALGAAVFASIANIFLKRSTDHLNEYVIIASRSVIFVICFGVALMFSGVPEIKPDFWKYVAIAVPIELVLTLLMFKAFALSPVSVVVPITSLAPLFVALFSYAFFGDTLRPIQLTSLFFFVLGVYLLNFEKLQFDQLLKPFKVIAADKGARYMFGATVLIGITTNLANRGIATSNPAFFSLIYWIIVGSIFIVAAIPSLRRARHEIKVHANNMVLFGVTSSIFILLLSVGFVRAPTPSLVSAIFYTNTLMTVLLAGTFLNESGLRTRLLASGSIFLGILLIVVA